MEFNFSLPYEPEEYNEIGYHTTLTLYKDDIIAKGFKPSTDIDDWLGEGVYFWDSEVNALWWKQRPSLTAKCIMICDLKCPIANYLNLDDEIKMKEFGLYSNRYIKDMSRKSGWKPSFANNNQRKKFFCDIYCSNNNIDILAFTFEHDNVNKAGFKIGTDKRRQICVRKPECISIISIKEG